MASVTIAQVQDAIAAVSIPGVLRVFTNTTAPVELFQRDCPALLPDPARAVEVSANVRQTLGGATWRRAVTLNYVCAIAEVGAGRAPREFGAQLSSVMDAVQNALCDLAAPVVIAIQSVTVGGAGIVTDATGKQFVGFTLQVALTTVYGD